jgi:hypothetical protein
MTDKRFDTTPKSKVKVRGHTRRTKHGVTVVSSHLRRKVPKGWKVSDPWEALYPPEQWDGTAPQSIREDLFRMNVTTDDDTVVELVFKDEPEFIEVYSIDAIPKGTGAGSQVIEILKEYADEKEKGFIATKVKNEAFAQHSNLTRRDPLINGQPLSEYTGYAEWIYGDVPEDAVDYSWVIS